ncbi:MAG: VOC family protein [Armatimonadota bacterium]|nr:VOC family protein [Armatimonadota bacterium]
MESLFAHLILDVASVDESLSFYHDQLGLVVAGVGELDGNRLATIIAGTTQILLLQQPEQDRPPVQDRGRGLVLNFKVSGLCDVASRLKQSHVQILRDLEDPPFGDRTFLISDPDGYAILLSEPVGTLH